MRRFIASLTCLIFAQAAGAQDQSPSASVQPPFIGGATPPTDLSTGSATTAYMETSSTPLATHLHWQDKLHMRSEHKQFRVQSAGVLDN